MIEIKSSDRDMLRFLWLKDLGNVESHMSELRFTRLVFGLCPSPAILGSVISHHLDKYQSKYPEIIPSIKNSFYVDDLISRGSTIEEAFKTYTVTKQAMLEVGFNLRNGIKILLNFFPKLFHFLENQWVIQLCKTMLMGSLSFYCWR